jgi:rhamnulose-1-phosphate aldolase/alcohol dehydrogenase
MPSYNYVTFAWDDAKAASLDPVGRLVYRSNLLGSDQRITNTGGGNTSSKLTEKDPLTGQSVEVLWVKGSGGDLRTSTRENFSSLYQQKLIGLQQLYAARADKGLKSAAEDDMVGMYTHATFNLNPRASSIDTPLHSFIPGKFVDHMHPNAIIAIAASRNCEQLTREIFGGEMAYVPWMRPGFELGLAMQEICRRQPKVKSIMMGQHGFISWADDDKACYTYTLDCIEKAAAYIEAKYAAKGGDAAAFGGAKYQTLDDARRAATFAAILPWLRGQVSKQKRFIGTVQDDAKILRFVNSKDAARLSELGTSCPDHFLRTKIKPLYVDWNPQAEDVAALKAKLTAALDAYRKDYAAYYAKCKHANSPAMRDPNPTVVLIPGLGMIAWGKDKSESRVTAEFYNCAVEVMRGAEAIDRIHRAPAAGGVRHRVLAARGSEAEAHAGGEGTRAPGHPGDRGRLRHRQRNRAPPREGRRAHRVRRHEARDGAGDREGDHRQAWTRDRRRRHGHLELRAGRGPRVQHHGAGQRPRDA